MKGIRFVDKVLSRKKIKKLDDRSVADISGGMSANSQGAFFSAGLVTAAGVGVGVIPLTACSAFCLYKAKKAQESGRTAEAKLMWNNYRALSLLTGGFSVGTALLSTAAGLMVRLA